MVYETKTLELCHRPTEAGEKEYHIMLERKADEMLFKHKHPFKYWWQRLGNLIKEGDSTWSGAHYPPDRKFKDGFEYTN